MIQPHELDELLVDPAAIELVPESVAREHCVLPVAIADNCLQIILPEIVNALGDATIARLEFVLEHDFTFDTAPREQLSRCVDLHYLASYSEIKNCNARFRFKCPKQWADLQPTKDKLVRLCGVCDNDVFYCYTEDELRDRASKNQCVAFCDYDASTITLGLLDEIPDSPTE